MDQFEDFATFIALLGVMVELSFVNFWYVLPSTHNKALKAYISNYFLVLNDKTMSTNGAGVL